MKQQRKRKIDKKWYLYVVECADQSLYTGITIDVVRRLHEHNHSVKGSKYTRARRPVILRMIKEYSNRSEASKAEINFKKLSRKKKLEIINENQPKVNKNKDKN